MLSFRVGGRTPSVTPSRSNMRKPSKFAKKDDANNEARKKMLKFFQVGFSKMLADHPLTKWVVEKKNATKDEKNACTVFLYIEDIKKKMFALERFLEGLRAKLQDLTQMMEGLTKNKSQRLATLESGIKDLIKRAGTFDSVGSLVDELKRLVAQPETKGTRGYSIRVLGDAPAQQPKLQNEGWPESANEKKAGSVEVKRSSGGRKSGKPAMGANLFASLMAIEKPTNLQPQKDVVTIPHQPIQIKPKLVAQPTTLEQLQVISEQQASNKESANLLLTESQELDKYKPLFELEPISPDKPNQISAGTLSIDREPDENYDTEEIRNQDPRLLNMDKQEDSISSIHSPEPGVPVSSMRKTFMLTTETDREASRKGQKLKYTYSSGRQISAFKNNKHEVAKSRPDAKTKQNAKLVSSHLHLKLKKDEKSRSRDPFQKQQRHNLFQSTAPKIESSPYNESPKIADQIRILSRYSSQDSQSPKRVNSPESKKVSQLKKVLKRKVIDQKSAMPQKLHANTVNINFSQTQEIRVKKPSAQGLQRLVLPNNLSREQPSLPDANETKTPKKQKTLSHDNREELTPAVLPDQQAPSAHLGIEEQNTLHLLPRRASRTSTMKVEVGPVRSSSQIENLNQGDDPEASFEVPNRSDSCSSSSQETEKLERKQTLNRRPSAMTNNRGPRSMTHITPSSDQNQHQN